MNKDEVNIQDFYGQVVQPNLTYAATDSVSSPFLENYYLNTTVSGFENGFVGIDKQNEATLFVNSDDDMISRVFYLGDNIRVLDIEEQIKEFEQIYQMDSEVFQRKWFKGELPDNADFYTWSNMIKRYNYVKNK